MSQIFKILETIDLGMLPGVRKRLHYLSLKCLPHIFILLDVSRESDARLRLGVVMGQVKCGDDFQAAQGWMAHWADAAIAGKRVVSMRPHLWEV